MGEGHRVACPHCKEPIHPNATKCPHCRSALGTSGQFLDPASNLKSCCLCPLVVAILAFGLWLAVNRAVYQGQ